MLKKIQNRINRSCLVCVNFKPEEIGDSDYGAVYSKESTCSEYLDTNPETEEEILTFDRCIERECCIIDFWYVLEFDKVLRQSFDEEMSEKNGDNFDKTYSIFEELYILK